jgi:hypothetical protein
MGRFDALTQIEEKQEKKTPLPDVASPTSNISQGQINKSESDSFKKPANPLAGKPANLQTRKTESPQTRKTANPLIETEVFEKPEKYTTRMIPSLVKKVRLHAIDKDMKDYEVISTALNEYFERNK